MSLGNRLQVTMCLLQQLKEGLAYEYSLYKQGDLTQEEYCVRVKPIDRAITRLEMATLQDNDFWKEACSLHTPKPKHYRVSVCKL